MCVTCRANELAEVQIGKEIEEKERKMAAVESHS